MGEQPPRTTSSGHLRQEAIAVALRRIAGGLAWPGDRRLAARPTIRLTRLRNRAAEEREFMSRKVADVFGAIAAWHHRLYDPEAAAKGYAERKATCPGGKSPRYSRDRFRNDAKSLSWRLRFYDAPSEPGDEDDPALQEWMDEFLNEERLKEFYGLHVVARLIERRYRAHSSETPATPPISKGDHVVGYRRSPPG